MPSPFPGMDPYLERAARWHPFHTLLVSGLVRVIEPVLPARYYVSVEERTCVVDSAGLETGRLPDAAVIGQDAPEFQGGTATAIAARGVQVLVPAPEVHRERYLEIRDLEQAEEVVTVIEVLSPANKTPGPGREEYLTKRAAILHSTTHLVEIDLLRSGPRMPALGAPEGAAYGILVSDARSRPHGFLVQFGVRDTVPPFPLPLRGEPEPDIRIGPLIAEIYGTGRYDRRIDYRRPPEPPFAPEDEEWADALLRDKGLR